MMQSLKSCLTFWHKFNIGLPWVIVNAYIIKYHHCMSNGNEVINVNFMELHNKKEMSSEYVGRP